MKKVPVTMLVGTCLEFIIPLSQVTRLTKFSQVPLHDNIILLGTMDLHNREMSLECYNVHVCGERT